ncbi:hypothetical protein JHK84_043521 [Glycine max]|nr:hypothetical protein JHK84_043521 [Glycine max]
MAIAIDHCRSKMTKGKKESMFHRTSIMKKFISRIRATTLSKTRDQAKIKSKANLRKRN